MLGIEIGFWNINFSVHSGIVLADRQREHYVIDEASAKETKNTLYSEQNDWAHRLFTDSRPKTVVYAIRGKA